jgi:hypothetical protein
MHMFLFARRHRQKQEAEGSVGYGATTSWKLLLPGFVHRRSGWKPGARNVILNTLVFATSVAA